MATPTGWRSTTIGEVCRFSSGHGFSKSDWTENGLPIIRIQNLNGSREFNYYDRDPEPAWIVEPGELLFAWAGVKGVSFGPTIWSGPRGLLNQHIYRIRPNKGIDLRWLYLALEVVTEQIEATAHGFKSSLVHVRQVDITGQVCAVPPEDEQERIASIVCTWDAAIAKCGELIEAKGRLKSSLMDQLLTGRRRFPGFGGTPLVDTPLGSVLSESRISGTDGATAKKLTVRLYGRGVCMKDDTRPGSAATKYYRRCSGQFVYSKLDFLNGAFGIIPPELDGYESTLDLPAFDVATTVDPRWLLSYVSRVGFYRNHLRLANGGRKARRVNPGDLLQIHVSLPSKEEQSQVADVLDVIDQEVELLQQGMKALIKQKKGVMHKLMSGLVRIKAVTV